MDDLSIDRTLGGAGAKDTGWSLAAGDTLGGYRVVKSLGRGGMGEVYLAENELTRKHYALKLLPADLARDSGFRKRFAREAAVLQELRHKGIVQVLHAAEEDGLYFLTMDYVEGGSLDDRLKAEGKLPENETARIALELCDALAYAHGKGVIHRDIKPANVLLEPDGRAKVSDFGLARVVGDDFLKSMTERSISLSMARTDGGGLSQSDNAVVGTYEYMSPEQKRGKADEKSDIYSLGLMVYRMLTGKMAEGRFPDPSKLGCTDAWDSIVDRALAPEPEDRYATVTDLGADVREAGEVASGAAEDVISLDDLVARLDRHHQRATYGAVAGVVGGTAQGIGESLGARTHRKSWIVNRRTCLPTGYDKTQVHPRLRENPEVIDDPDKLKDWLESHLDRPERASAVLDAARDFHAAERPTRVPVSPVLPPTLALDLGGGVTLDLVLIPAGEFMMGSPDDEESRSPGEGPQHRVRITKPFYMGKYEVTQAQYERIVGTNPSHFKGSNNPVEQVSWTDATSFCRKLSQRVEREIRLPTEAEWEYACRAGTTTPFHYGNSLSSSQANFDWGYPYGDAAKGVDRKKTTSVGDFAPNAWGFHDMHGNVWEWCADWYDEGYYAKSPGQDPTGPTSGGSRVLRGGSWYHTGRLCRSAYRDRIVPSYRIAYYGFRAVVAAPGR